MHDTRVLRKESRILTTRCEKRKLDIKPGCTGRFQGAVNLRYPESRILSHCSMK